LIAIATQYQEKSRIDQGGGEGLLNHLPEEKARGRWLIYCGRGARVGGKKKRKKKRGTLASFLEGRKKEKEFRKKLFGKVT